VGDDGCGSTTQHTPPRERGGTSKPALAAPTLLPRRPPPPCRLPTPLRPPLRRWWWSQRDGPETNRFCTCWRMPPQRAASAPPAHKGEEERKQRIGWRFRCGPVLQRPRRPWMVEGMRAGWKRVSRRGGGGTWWRPKGAGTSSGYSTGGDSRASAAAAVTSSAAAAVAAVDTASAASAAASDPAPATASPFAAFFAAFSAVRVRNEGQDGW